MYIKFLKFIIVLLNNAIKTISSIKTIGINMFIKSSGVQRKAALISLIFLFFMLTTSFSAMAEEAFKITLLYTNDTHSRLLPFKPSGIKAESAGGIERRAVYFNRVKKENPAALILDAGDLSQGTPFYNFFKGEAEFYAFAMAGYDYAAPGNHDFDYGLDNLRYHASKSGLHLICANLFDAKTLKPLFTPFVIKNIGGIKTAVIGIIGREAWDVVTNKHKEGILYADETSIINTLCKTLEKNVDFIILLSHSGYAADLKIAAAAPGIDLIIGAHTHTKLEKPVEVYNPFRPLKKTVVTQAFENGIYAGRLDFYFDSARRPIKYDSHFQLIDERFKSRNKSNLRKIVKYYEKRMKSEISLKIGDSLVEMSNTADMYNSADIPLGRYLCDAVKNISGADMFFTNTTTFRDKMPAGPITIETIYKISPFDNYVAIYKMNGKTLIEMFNFIALNFGKNESFQYGGASFAINFKTRKAESILINNQPIDENKIYTIATSSYIAQGNLMGDKLFSGAIESKNTGINIRDMLIEYIKKNKIINISGGQTAAGIRIKFINQ